MTPDSEPAEQSGDPAIIGPDGSPVATSDGSPTPLHDLVEQPAKVMRIGSMIRQLLEEVKSSPLDEASRIRLREIHQQSIKELEDGLAPELIDELGRETVLEFLDRLVVDLPQSDPALLVER